MPEDMFNYEISFEKMKKKDGICFISKLNEFPQMKSIEKTRRRKLTRTLKRLK